MMDKIVFCDKYCPTPTCYTNTQDPSDQYAECDIDESECPFNCVDFSKVTPTLQEVSHDQEIKP